MLNASIKSRPPVGFSRSSISNPDQWPPVIVLQPLGFPQGGAEIEGDPVPGVGAGELGPTFAAVLWQPIAVPF
jgi:hypothetical protein